jgi:hypothetical protein
VKQDTDRRFRIELGSGESIQAKVLVDAAGKQSRFGRLDSSPQFGVQFYSPGNHSDTMDFWFFADGYGGTVGIEDGRSNSCFLIERDALPRYLGKPGCRVTGPVAYGSRRSEYLAIGDAAGATSFYGEGFIMHLIREGARGCNWDWAGICMRKSGDAEYQRMQRWRASSLPHEGQRIAVIQLVLEGTNQRGGFAGEDQIFLSHSYHLRAAMVALQKQLQLHSGMEHFKEQEGGPQLPGGRQFFCPAGISPHTIHSLSVRSFGALPRLALAGIFGTPLMARRVSQLPAKSAGVACGVAVKHRPGFPPPFRFSTGLSTRVVFVSKRTAILPAASFAAWVRPCLSPVSRKPAARRCTT